VPPLSVSADELARLPRATTYARIPAAPSDVAPFTVTSGLVAHPLAQQVVYVAPGKKAVAVLPTAELGGPTWVPVVQTTPGWERVLLPSRPNHATGWIYTGAGTPGAGSAGSRLETRRSSYIVRVNLGSRQLSVYDGGTLRGTWTVAVGTEATPTPTGRTFLLASLEPPHPTYSPLILPLGTHSSTLETYGGGPGTVGLHGWPDPSVFGHAVSHGCVRVPAPALRVLSEVPLGSLVLVSRLRVAAGFTEGDIPAAAAAILPAAPPGATPNFGSFGRPPTRASTRQRPNFESFERSLTRASTGQRLNCAAGRSMTATAGAFEIVVTRTSSMSGDTGRRGRSPRE
jgi:lipoprotein-anchoring transpeptidase ErfK/SrfK